MLTDKNRGLIISRSNVNIGPDNDEADSDASYVDNDGTDNDDSGGVDNDDSNGTDNDGNDGIDNANGDGADNDTETGDDTDGTTDDDGNDNTYQFGDYGSSINIGLIGVVNFVSLSVQDVGNEMNS
ncbi:stress protein DDR48-like [Anneissia japonica]|uniref:stress protein DDR48-like n=1 Tax=Anneissia japonica TaxID=1529436 RepID=UPI0014256321|nr:stress protein DDR48-like [Anneissia japonica]